MAIIQRMFLTTLQTNWAFIQERNCVTFAPGVPDSVAHASAGPDADRDGRVQRRGGPIEEIHPSRIAMSGISKWPACL
jgi:hypothetical protein